MPKFESHTFAFHAGIIASTIAYEATAERHASRIIGPVVADNLLKREDRSDNELK